MLKKRLLTQINMFWMKRQNMLTPEGFTKTTGKPNGMSRIFGKPYGATGLDYSPKMFILPKENKGKKNIKRAIAEWASVMAVSQTNYWLKYSNWVEDWQYELTWADQKKRIFGFEGQKLDSNCFQTNWTHALSGTMYYNFARTNGFNILESSVFTTLSSFYWEFVVEWREVISINDNIFTSFGGVSIGESFFQLGSYFNGNSGIANKIAGILVNPIMAINRWLDKKKGFNYKTPYKSNLSVEKEGIIQKTIKGNIKSNINIKLEIKDKSIDEISAQTQNVFFGKYIQYVKSGSNHLKGHGFLYSLFSGFDFYKKKAIIDNDSCLEYKYIDDSIFVETPTEFTDKVAILNLIGPYTELTYFGAFNISLINSFSLDFGLINAYSLNDYSKTEDISYTKATLYNYGYYYGFGFTFNSKLRLTYKRINLGLEFKYQSYNSVEGVDRFEDKIKNDFNIHDTKSMFKFDIGYKFNILPVGLRLILEDRCRYGIMKNISKKHKETKVYVRMDVFL